MSESESNKYDMEDTEPVGTTTISEVVIEPDEYQAQLVKRLEKRVLETEALGATATPEDKEDLAGFRLQLEAEIATAKEVKEIIENKPVPDTLDALIGRFWAIIGGAAGIATYEKAWRLVFENFPGMRAAFQEIIALDAQEEELFQDRHDPDLRPVWRETHDRVLALWGPFKHDVVKKLSFLSAIRKFTVTITGEVKDDDDISNDESLEINDSNPGNMKIGDPPMAIVKTFTADQVRLDLNVNCRLLVGSETDPPLLGVTGSAKCFDGDSEKGSVAIDARISSGDKSGDFRAGTDVDFGLVAFSFDIES